MLALTRKKHQTIILHQNGIEIARLTVADIKGDRVRLGIDAPRSLSVDRLEVYEAKQREAVPALLAG